ncbi:MAG: hypothetical protein ACX94B_16355 [Henriciella sp.]
MKTRSALLSMLLLGVSVTVLPPVGGASAQDRTDQQRILPQLAEIESELPAIVFLKQAGLEELHGHVKDYQSFIVQDVAPSEMSQRILAEVRATRSDLQILLSGPVESTATNRPSFALEFLSENAFTEPVFAWNDLLFAAKSNSLELRQAYQEYNEARRCFALATEAAKPGLLFEIPSRTSSMSGDGAVDFTTKLTTSYRYASTREASNFQSAIVEVSLTARAMSTIEREVEFEIAELWFLLEETHQRLNSVESRIEEIDELLSAKGHVSATPSAEDLDLIHRNFKLNHELIELSFLNQIAAYQIAEISQPDTTRSSAQTGLDIHSPNPIVFKPTDGQPGAAISDRKKAGVDHRTVPTKTVRPLSESEFAAFRPRPVFRTSASSRQHFELLSFIRSGMPLSHPLDKVFNQTGSQFRTQPLCDWSERAPMK